MCNHRKKNVHFVFKKCTFRFCNYNIDNLKLYSVRDVITNTKLGEKIWYDRAQVIFIQKLNNKKYKFIEVYTIWSE